MSDALPLRLADAVDAVYRVFARYPLRAVIPGCPHCVDPEDDARLHRAELRALSAADLERFAWKAMTTFGNADDYRHFLPRILEIAIRDTLTSGFELFLIGTKLSLAEWQSWPADERQAIIAWVEAGLEALLAQPADDVDSLPRWDPSDLTELMVRSGLPVPEALAPYHVTPSPLDAPLPGGRAGADVGDGVSMRETSLDALLENVEGYEATPAREPVPDAWMHVTLLGRDQAAPSILPLYAGQRFTIGRIPACHLYIPELMAGRTNAVIDTTGRGKSELRHQGHLGVILVNGRRLTGSCWLADGDVVEHRDTRGRPVVRWTYAGPA